MKKLLLTLATIGAVATSYGQGIIAWGNAAGTASDNLQVKAANGTISDMPTRTTGNTATYYIAALFASSTAAGLTDHLLQPIAYGTNSAGIAGKLTVPNAQSGTPGGTVLFFQVRAWTFNMGGANGTSWDTVYANTTAGNSSMWYGESAVGQVTAQPPPNTSQNIWTTATVPIDGFVLQAVPEPSTIALVGLGLAGLVFIRRRK